MDGVAARSREKKTRARACLTAVMPEIIKVQLQTPMSNSQLVRTLSAFSAVPVCRRVAYHSLRTQFALSRRHYARPAILDKTQLPPRDEWRAHFATNGELMKRYTLRNPETARKLAETLVPEGSKDKIIIEANPGSQRRTLFRSPLMSPRSRRVDKSSPGAASWSY